MIAGIADIVIGVRDPANWVALARDQLQFDVRAEGRDDGPLGEGSSGAIVLAPPGAETGRIRLIHYPEGRTAGRPDIRDLGFFDFDIYSRDCDATYAQLVRNGYHFRTPPATWSLDSPPLTLTEALLLAPDDVNLVFIGTAQPRGAAAYAADPNRRYSEASSAVAVVPDLDVALRFWRDGLGYQVLLDFHLQHPALEPLLGIPPTEGFRMALLAKGGETARIELIAFPPDRPRGVDRTANRAGTIGLLAWGFRSTDLTADLAAIEAAGGRVDSPPRLVRDAVHGRARVATASTPDHLLLELWQEE
ncbi:MAG: VOC family protein [Chloroflexota bacterium]|nr:VOC family protein [Dehalococcoidia bacterium]MDW8253728.1 VOC family protein [Chloroflexota bacterium]